MCPKINSVIKNNLQIYETIELTVCCFMHWNSVNLQSIRVQNILEISTMHKTFAMNIDVKIIFPTNTFP